MLRYLPALTVGLFVGPVVFGLLGTLLPAFGYLPALGSEEFSLEPWRRLVAAPGLATAVRVTLSTGFASTVIALALTILLFAAGHGTAAFDRIRRGMVPLLAVPHLALAVGLAFLIAPSGWLVRLVAPWPTGWQTPPDIPLVQDPLGLALAFGLVLKEIPFLVLMTFGALGQVHAGTELPGFIDRAAAHRDHPGFARAVDLVDRRLPQALGLPRELRIERHGRAHHAG